MRNVVFIDLNKNIFNTSEKLFNKNKFSLKYLNKFCGYLVPKENTKINVWITIGLNNKHNLMVYDKIDKAFLVVSDASDIWNDLKITYNQLKKKSKNIVMISLNIEKIEQKRSLLKWCIENNNISFIEINKDDDLSIDKLYF
jgi:hypothetical protein